MAQAQYHPYLRVHCGIASSFWSTTTISGDSPWLTLLYGHLFFFEVSLCRSSCCLHVPQLFWGDFPSLEGFCSFFIFKKLDKHTLWMVGGCFQKKKPQLANWRCFSPRSCSNLIWGIYRPHFHRTCLSFWVKSSLRNRKQGNKNVFLKKFEKNLSLKIAFWKLLRGLVVFIIIPDPPFFSLWGMLLHSSQDIMPHDLTCLGKSNHDGFQVSISLKSFQQSRLSKD